MKKEKSKKIKKQLIISVAAVAVIAAVIAALNYSAVNFLVKEATLISSVEYENQLVPKQEENGNWVFTTDEDFKVMHLTDIHIGGGFLSRKVDLKALDTVAAMVQREKPDLVIATGDIAFPVPYTAGTFNNHSGAKAFATLMETLGVYWDVTFGNHDAEAYSYFDRQAMAEFYENESYKYCLFQAGPEDVDGYGNHVIEIKNTRGIITQALILIDSQDYVNSNIIDSIKGTYDNIHPNQIKWYENEITRMNAENEKINKNAVPVKSMAFFHIPLAETGEGWEEFEANNFTDTESFKYIDGIIGEGGRRFYSGLGEDEMFEKMLELGSTKAIFNGHDHLNYTTFEYKGIQFSYGYSIDFFAYSGIDSQGSQRGCSMITSKPDGSFTIDKYNYYSSSRYPSDKQSITMQHEDVTYQVQAQ